MVNTGKPSGGCRLCRARRIKCDEAKPACLRCVRSNRQCPGYRDPFEGKIRDETQATIRKFKRTRIVVEKEQVLREEGLRIDGSAVPDAEDSETPLSASSTSSFDSIHTDYITTLATPIEQQATCYLLANYVLVSDTVSIRRGYYKFAYKILARPQRPSKCLLSAFKAVSFVALASRPGASHLVIEAESHYSKALREVNKAIQDPAQVKNDDTLAAVLLLAFYETLASTRERLDEYISHINGAAQLVKMRGPSQNDYEEGAEMFSMTRNQFLAMRSMSLTSSPGKEDYSWLLHQSCSDTYVSKVATLTITCSEIRMKVDRVLASGQRNPAKIAAVLEMLRTAQAIAKRLAGLDQSQHGVWTLGKKRGLPVPAGGERLPPGEVYQFHNLYVCMIYAIIWTSHLFLTTCIFRCMAWLVSPDEWRTGDDYEATVQVTKRRIADIVASLPYACSWNGNEADEGDFACGKPSVDSQTKGVAGMCVFRPAFSAMMSDYATPEQKSYLQDRLRFLADSVGIKQVNVLLMRQETAHPSKDIERDKLQVQTADCGCSSDFKS